MPINGPYDIGVNGGNGQYSRWFRLHITVEPQGVIRVQNTMENDTLQGWSGAYRLEFFDLRTHGLLFRMESPVYKIGPKPPGRAISKRVDDIAIPIAPELAQMINAYPDVYGVSIPERYADGDLFFDGSGLYIERLGEAVVTYVAS